MTRQKIIDFASLFGTLVVEPHITQSSGMLKINACNSYSLYANHLEKLQKIAFLTFTEQSAVQRCMNGDRQTYTVAGYPVTVQRWLPVGLTFDRSYRVLLFLDTSNSNCKLNEDDIRIYFDTHYGQTKAFFWSSDTAATMDFEE